MRWLAIAVLLVATRAAAQTVDDHLARVRALYEKGDFVDARAELLAAYQLDARPELLFALGQVELNLGQFAKAIDYYERFIASEPGTEQVALAQQAIGAARARLAEKPPVAPPPRPPPHRRWDAADSALAALGGTTLLAGTGLFVYGYRLAGDRSGRLTQYDGRLSRATRWQWIGAGGIAAGAITLAGALLRWRLHLVESEIQPMVAPRTAGVSWLRWW